MVICTRQKNANPVIDIQINNHHIDQIKDTQFLGITLNNNLEWKSHINKVSHKVGNVSHTLYKAGKSLSKQTKLEVYNALALPHLMYGNII